jgi:MoaA/NifB/PqqE/SkfB family radical SAM enzyme
MPTFRCPAQCRHCGTNSHPRELTWLSPDLILDVIDQAARAGYAEVVFSGGEPTLAGNSLLVAMQHARERDLRVRLVTNAYWAKTREDAARILDDFLACGLGYVTLSTGDEHARFVPLASVINAARGCAERSLPATIVTESCNGRTITTRTIEADASFQEIRSAFPNAPLNITDWTWSPLSPFRYGRYADGETANGDNLDRRGGCDEIFATTTLQADGTLSPCCGLGIRFTPDLKLGNIRDVTLKDADARARQSFLNRWISTEGPERILAWAAAQDTTIAWEGRYAHRCQACIRVFADPKVRALVETRRHEKMTTVKFLETLLQPALGTSAKRSSSG